MRKGIRSMTVAPGLLLVAAAFWGGAAFADPQPEIIELRGAVSMGTSTPTVFNGDLRDLPRAPEWQPGDSIKEIPRRHQHPPRLVPPAAKPEIDPLLAVQAGAPRTGRALTPPILNFAGQGFTGVNPPDTVGDVGLNHYIQSINGSGGAVFTVYNKADGTVAAGPVAMDSLGTGNCATGFGDPVVLFDQLADRWFLSEFSSSGNRMCVYISQTSDPISGGWFAYQFTAPSFPDYPKFGVWPDAYYASSNESTPAAYAFDRLQMLAGGTATAQRFSAPSLAAFGFQALIPADADGATPPPGGAPNPFMRHRDDEAHNAGSNDTTRDFLEIWNYHVDFATPANSTFTGPVNIPVASFDSELCGFTSFNCFPQQGSGTTLDPLREVVMNRLQYRNFGAHQTLVGNFVTDVDGTNHGGIRWFELRNTGSGWTLHQEGTYAPDAHSRWMGSAAMDGGGNIAVGYSVSSTTMFPSIRYTGRRASQPLGTVEPEISVVAGSSANASNRWGDYAALAVDPVDDSTFWLTTMYSPSTSWATRIATFKLCTPPGTPTIGTATAAAPNRIDVTWTNGTPPSTTFNVYRATGTCAAPGPFTQIATGVAGSPYQDTGVSGGLTYAYRVTGIADACEGDPTGCVEATATGACLLAPTFAGLASVTNPATATCGLSLAWSAATANCAGPITYNIYRSTTSGFVPGAGNQIASGVSGTGYTDVGPLTNGTTYYYVVRAVDGSNSVGESNTVQRSAVPTGPVSTALADTFEGTQSGGGFDNAGWTHGAVAGSVDWVHSTAQSQTPTHSWFSASPTSVSSRALVTPSFAPQAGTTLSFWHTYAFEGTVAQCYDGGTLEISTNGGSTWSVVPDAAFTSGGFTGTINSGFSNPLAGKRAWCSGSIGAMTKVNVNLSSFAGSPNVKVRWHEGDDSSAQATGWYVDSVSLSSAATCSSTPPVPLDYHSLTPCRIVDTRNAAGPLGGPALVASANRTFVLTGTCGVPSTAKAVTVNMTAIQPAAAGYLTLFPANQGEPLAASITFASGAILSNNATIGLATDASGGVTVKNGSAGTLHLAIDVTGYYE